MNFAEVTQGVWHMEPGPADVHTHPRVFDALTQQAVDPEQPGVEGKAGIAEYTAVALRSGITAMVAMPNETLRVFDPTVPDRTMTIDYPIANRDRVLAHGSIIGHEAVIPTGSYAGLDPTKIYTDEQRDTVDLDYVEQQFIEMADYVMAFKGYLAETFGGFNIPVEHAAPIIQRWHNTNPGKPVVLHVEGHNVGKVLADVTHLADGYDIALHIAHVSSREELDAVIQAKKQGMNVTCEFTPHHLTLQAGEGIVKPDLKSKQDVDYLRANICYADIIASDCAPHRSIDKERNTPGLENHTFMLPAMMGLVKDGVLTMQELYEKTVTKSRVRFNLPLVSDNSFAVLDTNPDWQAPEAYREQTKVAYEQNPLLQLPPDRKRTIRLAGKVVEAATATSHYSSSEESLKTSYANWLRPSA